MTISTDILFSKKGFTIVELLVAISVVGILSYLSAVSYSAWRDDVGRQQVFSDFKGVEAAMENERNFGSGYPTQLPKSFSSSEGVTLSYIHGNADSYCIQSVNDRQPSVIYYISSTDSETPKQGTCPPAPLLPFSAPLVSGVSVQVGTATINWSEVSGASRYEVRYQRDTDAWTNVTAAAGTSRTVSGLTVPASYKFQVRAVNAVGAVENISPWSTVVNRVTVPPPVIASYVDQGCANSGQTAYAWKNIRLNFQATSAVYTTSYRTVGYSTVDGGSNNGTTAFVVGNTTSWGANVTGGGTISVRAIGPNGEQSSAITWTSPTYPPYEC